MQDMFTAQARTAAVRSLARNARRLSGVPKLFHQAAPLRRRAAGLLPEWGVRRLQYAVESYGHGSGTERGRAAAGPFQTAPRDEPSRRQKPALTRPHERCVREERATCGGASAARTGTKSYRLLGRRDRYRKTVQVPLRDATVWLAPRRRVGLNDGAFRDGKALSDRYASAASNLDGPGGQRMPQP